MVELFTHLQHQPEFPRGDLTEENASVLEVLLYDPTFLETAHNEAEQGFVLYRHTHGVVTALAKQLDKTSISDGLHIRASIYETIGGLVSRDSTKHLAVMTEQTAFSLSGGRIPSSQSVVEHLDSASSQLQKECPILSGVIVELSSLRSRSLVAPALAGAGIARKIEIDTPKV